MLSVVHFPVFHVSIDMELLATTPTLLNLQLFALNIQAHSLISFH